MLNSDLVKLYEVLTSGLNEHVKQNTECLPKNFIFKLTDKECEDLKSQNATSNWGERKKIPNVCIKLPDYLKANKSIPVLLTVFFLLTSFSAFSQYQKESQIVNYEINCVVNSNKTLLVNITKLLKIESSKDRSYAIQRVYYNEMSPITYISASVLDKNKKRVRKIKKKEIADYSTITEYLYSDSRYKEIRAFSEDYPYYIELKYRKEFQEFLSFPTWLPQERNISCIYSTYSLTIPEGYKIHYRFYNFKPSETVTTNKDGTTTYVWNTNNLFPVNTAELFSPPLRKVVPYGRIIPDSFVFDDKRGYMNRWSDLGNWISELIEGP